MFRTGSGKSVLISESSVQKARAVLEEEGNINEGITAHQTFLRLFHRCTNCYFNFKRRLYMHSVESQSVL